MIKAKIKRPQPNQQVKTHSSTHKTATTFSDHVTELRRRSMWVGLFFIIFSALAYNYHDVLLKIIMAPLHGEKLIYLTPGGGFSFIFLVCMYAGLLATIPAFMYHLHAFVKPALPERAQRSAFRIILGASILTVSGVLYGYFIAIPAALQFLMNFAGDTVTPNLTAESYLNFFLAYVAGLAILSLLPMILLFVHWIKPLRPAGLLKSERWVILFSFVAAALITPTPDIVNQLMIALPVIGIYQIGVVGILISILSKGRRTTDAKPGARDHAIPEDVLSSMAISPVPAVPAATKETSSTSKPKLAAASTAANKLEQVSKPRQQQAVRSIDGFRSSSRPLVTARPVMPRPLRRSIDGVVARRSRPS